MGLHNMLLKTIEIIGYYCCCLNTSIPNVKLTEVSFLVCMYIKIFAFKIKSAKENLIENKYLNCQFPSLCMYLYFFNWLIILIFYCLSCFGELEIDLKQIIQISSLNSKTMMVLERAKVNCCFFNLILKRIFIYTFN